MKRMMNWRTGASAIFVVVFASMVLSLIAVSFVGLMVREEARSTDDEQSQGAYDAAMAGVEDGKRVLLECAQGVGTQKTDACNAIAAQSCTTVIDSKISGQSGDTEVPVVSSSGSTNELNLAYTCVIVTPDTADYVGTLASSPAGADASVVIPLRSVTPFDTVDIYWFTEKDAAVPQVPSVTSAELPSLTTANWPSNQPPIMRVQMMQYESGNLSAANFDDDEYAHTAYLYPAQAGLEDFDFSTIDTRRSGDIVPRLVSCQNASYPVSGYACHASISMPSGGAVQATDREAYLRLTSIYNGANYRIVMRSGGHTGDVVRFNDVQPSIDATGRANDLFRRVEVRVETAATLPYPRATVDITGNLCKTFSVGADADDYEDGTGACNPNS